MGMNNLKVDGRQLLKIKVFYNYFIYFTYSFIHNNNDKKKTRKNANYQHPPHGINNNLPPPPLLQNRTKKKEIWKKLRPFSANLCILLSILVFYFPIFRI